MTQRIKSFLAVLLIWLVLGFAAYGVFCTTGGNVAHAKSKEPGCEQFAKIGMWDVYHCVDSSGHEFIGNSAGMLIAVGN